VIKSFAIDQYACFSVTMILSFMYFVLVNIYVLLKQFSRQNM